MISGAKTSEEPERVMNGVQQSKGPERLVNAVQTSKIHEKMINEVQPSKNQENHPLHTTNNKLSNEKMAHEIIQCPNYKLVLEDVLPRNDNELATLEALYNMMYSELCTGVLNQGFLNVLGYICQVA